MKSLWTWTIFEKVVRTCAYEHACGTLILYIHKYTIRMYTIGWISTLQVFWSSCKISNASRSISSLFGQVSSPELMEDANPAKHRSCPPLMELPHQQPSIETVEAKTIVYKKVVIGHNTFIPILFVELPNHKKTKRQM